MARTNNKYYILPGLPLRGIMVFPHMTMHFDVGRDKSVTAIEQAFEGNRLVFFIAQRDQSEMNPTIRDCYTVGTIARIKQINRLPDNTTRVLAEGLARATIMKVVEDEPYLKIRVAELKDLTLMSAEEVEAFMRVARRNLEQLASDGGRLPTDAANAIQEIDNPSEFCDVCAINALMRLDERQEILNISDYGLRLEKLCELLAKETQVSVIERSVQSKIQAHVEKVNREAYLYEQLSAIRKELGGRAEDFTEDLRRKYNELKPVLPEEADEKISRDLSRLERVHPDSPESGVLQNKLEWLLSMPWETPAMVETDIKRAKKILEDDHYGLEEVKKRLIEFIAVSTIIMREMERTEAERNKNKQNKDDQQETGKTSKRLKNTDGRQADEPVFETKRTNPILCLVGPPGVGKTSIARSIARALDRRFVNMSLGGLHDEAEIRGHRSTYIGAMPGGLVSGLRRAKVANPVFLLDEIDKLGYGVHGDPSAALLEALDPEQNKTFRDLFLDVPFDLSRVMFITTANTTDTIPRPLLDRMEIIEIPSYTNLEKLQIAKRYLLPKQRAAHVMNAGKLKISDDVLNEVIECYTREAGVRELERMIAALCRKAAVSMMESERASMSVTKKTVEEMLGTPKYLRDHLETKPICGVVNGLAYTPVGGSTLTVECSISPGSGSLEVTGNLGDVMKESAKAAMSFIRANSKTLGLESDFYQKTDIHVHVPEGAIPKDGPSAGVTLTCAILSALTGRAARQDVAMTGEITLRGRVLPIGGVREKVLAAYRNDIHIVMLPEENMRDLKEIPEQARQHMDFKPLRTVDDAFNCVLI